jgi:UrcA family protein
MKNQSGALAVIVLLSGIAVPAVAQSASEPTEEVTVFAPYVVTKTVTKPLRSIPVTTMNMSRSISYHGLDLTSDTDVATLDARVKQAADDVCKELERRYPKARYASVEDDKNCAKNAYDSTMSEVRTVVAAARGK